MYLRGFGYLWSFLLSFTKITIISLRKVKTKQHICVIFVKIQYFFEKSKKCIVLLDSKGYNKNILKYVKKFK